MSSNKRVMGSIDRLSALPDCLLIHILSFLSIDTKVKVKAKTNVRDAARTSVLSKRWRYLWCELTTLRFIHFDADDDIVKTSKFVAMVHRILLSRTSKLLDNFSVIFIPYNHAWAFDVDIWVKLALQLKSKIVNLSLPPYDSIRYSPSELLYSNSILTELTLHYCIVAPQRRVDWKSLTKLRMADVELHQHVVENILSGCPVMRSLELHGCWGFNSLKIDSPRLHKLSVIEDEMDASLETLEISAPYLSILEIKIWPEGRKICLKNISADVEVKVDIDTGLHIIERIPAHVINVVKKLFDEIQHIKKLHMKTSFFHFVAKMVADGWPLQHHSRLLSLKIDINLYSDPIHSCVSSILEFCPNLETLQLHEVTKAPYHFPMSDDDLNCNLLNLKMVGMKISVMIDEIRVESSLILMLVRILLKRAVALEKIEIQFEIMYRDVEIKDRERFGNVVQELLALPKSSQALLITSLTHTKYRNW